MHTSLLVMACLQRRFGRSFFQEQHADCAARKLFVNYRRSMYCHELRRVITSTARATTRPFTNVSATVAPRRWPRRSATVGSTLEGSGSDNFVYNDIDLYGRQGGNCTQAYLVDSPRCHYNPATVVCNNTRIEPESFEEEE
ncbi:hypothetical protein MRX96_026597 [Rhipicephalus microplus]